jgi:protein-tyrosine phosphatase
MSQWFHSYGYAEVAEGLLTGAYPLDADDVAVLAAEGVTAVCNLCADSEYEPGERDEVVAALAAHGIVEERLETEDFGHLLPGALERASGWVLDRLAAGDRVYLHCRAGWQRSPAAAAAVLARRDDVEPDEALARVRSRKRDAAPLEHQAEDLRRWWRARAARQA